MPRRFNQRKPSTNKKEEQVVATTAPTTLQLFTSHCVFEHHHSAQQTTGEEYFGTFELLMKNETEIKDSAKIRILAALWSRKQYAIAQTILETYPTQFGLPEVLKALTLLDSARQARALEKRMAQLQKNANVKPKTLGRLTAQINNLKREPVIGSVSGALIRHVRKWVSTIQPAALHFYLMQFPKEPWQKLADMLHLNPEKDFTEPWFLKVVYGGEAPAGTVVADYLRVQKDESFGGEFVAKHNVTFEVARKQKNLMIPSVINVIAEAASLDTLLWWYHEMAPISPKVAEFVAEKLETATSINLTYGKLMERLLAFEMQKVPFYQKLIPFAEERLKNYKLPIATPVLCLGDASSSMQQAIRVATIIASLLTALSQADLLFFNSKAFKPDCVPKTIEEVMTVATKARANGSTANAAGLWEAYKNKKVYQTIIMVTDEEENTSCEGYMFAPLFKKYREEVNPEAQVVMVSFLKSTSAKGQMTTALEAEGIKPLTQVRLDQRMPDLTKLDTLLSLLSAETVEFKSQVKA